MIMNRMRLKPSLAALLAVALSGCGSEESGVVTVRGTVTLDGRPVEGAAVMIEPSADGTPATAITDASGRFKVQALLGQSRVAVSKTVTVGGSKGLMRADEGVRLSGNTDRITMTYLTPSKYASALTSGLTLDVQAGMDPVSLAMRSR